MEAAAIKPPDPVHFSYSNHLDRCIAYTFECEKEREKPPPKKPAMPRTSSSSGTKPILGRAMAILALPLTPISKAKPAARSLLLFKKQRRRLRHYNYAYVGEYQFSPSSSPLIARPPPGVSTWRRTAARNKRRSRARMILASLFCGGCGFELDAAALDGLQQPRAPEEEAPRAVGWAGDVDAYGEHDEEDEEDEDWGDDEVDGRAERFIDRFYEEMRLQRQRSLSRRLL